MVSHFDGTYHELYRRPTYDSVEDLRKQRMKREAKEIIELRQPPVPTQEMENEYIDFLQEDFKSDPWLTFRFRKYTANPKRIPWKKSIELKREYQREFLLTWIIGAAVSLPIASMVGKSYQST